jgi:hypothetical protein
VDLRQIPRVSSVSPKYGVVGTVLNVSGDAFVGNSLHCGFGSHLFAATEIIEYSSVQCRVPPLKLGFTSVFVSSDDRNYSNSQTLFVCSRLQLSKPLARFHFDLK